MDENILRRLRNQIPDADPVFGENENEYMLDDQAVEDFFTDAIESYPSSATATNILRAAAFANLAMATSEAIISKVIRTQDLQTNGALVADALTKRAQELLERADKIDQQTLSEYFTIIDFGAGWKHPAELTEPETF